MVSIRALTTPTGLCIKCVIFGRLIAKVDLICTVGKMVLQRLKANCTVDFFQSQLQCLVLWRSKNSAKHFWNKEGLKWRLWRPKVPNPSGAALLAGTMMYAFIPARLCVIGTEDTSSLITWRVWVCAAVGERERARVQLWRPAGLEDHILDNIKNFIKGQATKQDNTVGPRANDKWCAQDIATWVSGNV